MRHNKIKYWGKKKIKPNTKKSIIFCISDAQYVYVLRNDAKFCCPLCRKHEWLERKTLGYTKLLIKGTQKELKKFYWENPTWKQNPLKNDFVKISLIIDTQDMSKSWKKVFDGFLVYYFSNRPKAPFEVYVNNERFKAGSIFKKNCAVTIPTKFTVAH